MQNQFTTRLWDFFSGLSFFEILILGFWLLTLTMLLYILNNLYQHSRRQQKAVRWKYITDTAIRNAIFAETPQFVVPRRLRKLLTNPYFRGAFTKELIKAKQNLSGSAVQNLREFFLELKLDAYVHKMLDHRSWHINAAAIQQAGDMDLTEFRGRLLQYSESKRRLLRIEAQNSLLKFDSTPGLRFLDQAEFPLSDWQQIKILERISKWKPEDIQGIEIWLNSNNETVVIFALKLVRTQFRFEFYNDVVRCLSHIREEVRKEAIMTLSVFQSEETARTLISYFSDETERNRLLILRSLAGLSSEEEIPFLLSILNDPVNQVKLAAANALASIGGTGMEALEKFPGADGSPYREIIQHVKSAKR